MEGTIRGNNWSFVMVAVPAFWVAALWVSAMNRKKIIIWL